VRIRTLFPTGGLSIIADGERLKQVFLNILLNALDALVKSKSKEITIEAKTENNFAVVEITDSGKGIPPESLSDIWKPFFTKKKDGTGLGLAVTKKIVEEHGGTIEAFNVFPAGTKIRVAIPVQ